MGDASPLYVCFYSIGLLFRISCVVLLVLSVCGIFIPGKRDRIIVAVSNASWLVILTSGLVGIAYISEALTAINSSNAFERAAFSYRVYGPYAWAYWLSLLFNVVVPQLFCLPRCRKSLRWAGLISLVCVAAIESDRLMAIAASFYTAR